MRKNKQKQIELLQDFFLTKKNLVFQEIDWGNIFSWSKNLDLNAELNHLTEIFSLNSLTLFDPSGKIISYAKSPCEWDKLKVKFNTFNEKWVKSYNQSEFQIGISIENIRKQNFYISMRANKENFKFENIKILSSILVLLSLSTKQKEREDENIIKIDSHQHTAFPVIEESKLHVVRTSNITKHSANIKEITQQLGYKPQVLNPSNVEFKNNENEIYIINNIQNWDHLQHDFYDKYLKESTEGRSAPTVLLCFDSDPLYLYRKGKLIEQIFNLISNVQSYEYSLETIKESVLDENKLKEIFDTVWSEAENKAA